MEWMEVEKTNIISRHNDAFTLQKKKERKNKGQQTKRKEKQSEARNDTNAALVIFHSAGWKCACNIGKNWLVLDAISYDPWFLSPLSNGNVGTIFVELIANLW